MAKRRLRRWTVVTDRGAFIVHATSAAAAARKIPRDRTVVEVRPRYYVPPTRREP